MDLECGQMPPRLSAALGALLVITSTTGCGPTVRPALPETTQTKNASPRLQLIGEYSIPPLTEFAALRAARFGGVSGIVLDPNTGELLGVCDDSADSRVFVFRVPTPASSTVPFRVDLHAYFPLPPDAAAPRMLDPEAITITKDGRLFVASEGIGSRQPRVPPAVVEYSRNYQYVGQLEIPQKFMPPATGDAAWGVRANAAFESLTLAPDGERLYTATESPLAQDGPEATVEHGARIRVLEFAKTGSAYQPAREFAYDIDALPDPGFAPRFAVTGLVELLSIGGTDFLAMERGYAEEEGESGRRRNTIRIFQMSIDGATDISTMDSLRGQGNIRAARKTLLLDFSTIRGLSPELAALDNFEGMAFGPPLSDGSRTLIVVSDDNFSRRQRTGFMVFKVVGF